ncbi:putative Glucokinase [[Clostridium] ultunense Esp]|nr:putative Glucokinase [[Clostridium] ultunense Esp]
MAFSIGVDIGGTKIALGIVDRKGMIIKKMRFKTPENGRDELLFQLIRNIEVLIESTFLRKNIDGIGIGTAGQIDHRKGIVVSGISTIKNWMNVPIKEIFESHLGLSTLVENDANVVALSERMTEGGRKEQSLVCLTLGTGVGGAVIDHGQLLHGKWGGAAELGHMSIDRNGIACTCGSRGCLELYASGTGLVRMMKERSGEVLTSEEVFKRFLHGDKIAKQAIEEMLDAISIGIVNLIHIFNPEAVILGGGLTEQGDWLISAISEKVRKTGMPSLVQNTKIRKVFYGSDAGIIGAASLVWLND